MQTRKFIEVKKDPKEPMDQLIAELDKAEMRYHYVPLSEFRDHILPKSGLAWAKDPEKVKSLLEKAEDGGLFLSKEDDQSRQSATTDYRDMSESERNTGSP